MVYCSKCSNQQISLPNQNKGVRVCLHCLHQIRWFSQIQIVSCQYFIQKEALIYRQEVEQFHDDSISYVIDRFDNESNVSQMNVLLSEPTWITQINTTKFKLDDAFTVSKLPTGQGHLPHESICSLFEFSAMYERLQLISAFCLDINEMLDLQEISLSDSSNKNTITESQQKATIFILLVVGAQIYSIITQLPDDIPLFKFLDSSYYKIRAMLQFICELKSCSDKKPVQFSFDILNRFSVSPVSPQTVRQSSASNLTPPSSFNNLPEIDIDIEPLPIINEPKNQNQNQLNVSVEKNPLPPLPTVAAPVSVPDNPPNQQETPNNNNSSTQEESGGLFGKLFAKKPTPPTPVQSNEPEVEKQENPIDDTLSKDNITVEQNELPKEEEKPKTGLLGKLFSKKSEKEISISNNEVPAPPDEIPPPPPTMDAPLSIPDSEQSNNNNSSTQEESGGLFGKLFSKKAKDSTPVPPSNESEIEKQEEHLSDGDELLDEDDCNENESTANDQANKSGFFSFFRKKETKEEEYSDLEQTEQPETSQSEETTEQTQITEPAAPKKSFFERIKGLRSSTSDLSAELNTSDENQLANSSESDTTVEQQQKEPEEPKKLEEQPKASRFSGWSLFKKSQDVDEKAKPISDSGVPLPSPSLDLDDDPMPEFPSNLSSSTEEQQQQQNENKKQEIEKEEKPLEKEQISSPAPVNVMSEMKNKLSGMKFAPPDPLQAPKKSSNQIKEENTTIDDPLSVSVSSSPLPAPVSSPPPVIAAPSPGFSYAEKMKQEKERKEKERQALLQKQKEEAEKLPEVENNLFGDSNDIDDDLFGGGKATSAPKESKPKEEIKPAAIIEEKKIEKPNNDISIAKPLPSKPSASNNDDIFGGSDDIDDSDIFSSSKISSSSSNIFGSSSTTTDSKPVEDEEDDDPFFKPQPVDNKSINDKKSDDTQNISSKPQEENKEEEKKSDNIADTSSASNLFGDNDNKDSSSTTKQTIEPKEEEKPKADSIFKEESKKQTSTSNLFGDDDELFIIPKSKPKTTNNNSSKSSLLDSVDDDLLSLTKKTTPPPKKTETTSSTLKSSQSSVFSGFDEEDDFASVFANKPSSKSKQISQSSGSLFDFPDDEENELFVSKKPAKPTNTKKSTKSNLFDDNDDLFGF